MNNGKLDEAMEFCFRITDLSEQQSNPLIKMKLYLSYLLLPYLHSPLLIGWDFVVLMETV